MKRYKGFEVAKTAHGYEAILPKHIAERPLRAEKIAGIKSLIDMKLSQKTATYCRYGTYQAIPLSLALKSDGKLKERVRFTDGQIYFIHSRK